MIINHNLSAMFADRSLRVTNDETTKGMEKLSSGLRINRAGDDASGLAVWDGKNKAGRLAASDIYLALIDWKGEKKILKLVLEK